jgi:hypothetical protein
MTVAIGPETADLVIAKTDGPIPAPQQPRLDDNSKKRNASRLR